MTERAAHALPVAAGSLAGALIGLATLRGGPLDGAASAWALWTAFGALVGFALILLRPLLGALASWYGTRPMAVASVLLVAATVPAALELGARPWATRVPAGALVAWAVVAAVAVAAAQSLAWLFARKEGGLPVIPVLLVVVVTTALLPESALLPLPLGRWTIACGLVFAACAVLRVRWRWSAIGWPVAGVAALILLSIGPAAPLASEHLLTSTIRAPFVQAPHGPSAASLARLGQVFGRSVSGRSAELASLVPDRRLNVLWITVCTFRHDRLGKADVTPSIDDLARGFHRRYWPRHQVALYLVASFLAQAIELFLRLDPLGHHRGAEHCGHLQDRSQHVPGALFAKLNEAAVDLDRVERKARQIAERGIAGAEIVQRNAYAHRAQGIQRPDGSAIVVDQHALGDFQFEPTRIEAAF